ncbi:MAG: small multi-drug export protein [Treponema sp.]|nr:small multi-drug export protein [Treponema sp.]
MITKYLLVFLISMVPLIELRGAIPVAAAWGLMPTDNMPKLMAAYALCIVGNMLPVPVIYLFARRFLEWGQDKKFISGICTFFLTKGAKAGKKLEAKAGHGLFIALLLFVGIPLPGTGAWTGTLGASLLDMKFKPTILAVMGGVLLAGIIMMLASLGVLGAAGAVLN